MLNREQRLMLFKARRTTNCLFSNLPVELIREIGLFGCDDTAFNKALRHAALGTDGDLAIVVEMVKANPRLLLQTGHVVTRGGVGVRYTTLYEFFLGEGDPDAAKQIEFGFANIPNGENERKRQYEQYEPHIKALAKQVASKQPAFDLRPLFKMIKESSAADITEALNINDPNRTVTRNTPLRASLAQFRNAVNPKKSISVGMHYEHYTTLSQAFDLLDDEWKALSDNYTNYDKCRLVWRQIIGYLQLSLPAVDRFAFARAFENKERTLNFKYDNGSSYPDLTGADGGSSFSGLGVDNAIFGRARCADWMVCLAARGAVWKTHVEQKLQACRTYAATSRTENKVSTCDLLM